MVIGTDFIGSCKSNYHTIMAFSIAPSVFSNVYVYHAIIDHSDVIILLITVSLNNMIKFVLAWSSLFCLSERSSCESRLGFVYGV